MRMAVRAMRVPGIMVVGVIMTMRVFVVIVVVGVIVTLMMMIMSVMWMIVIVVMMRVIVQVSVAGRAQALVQHPGADCDN